MHLHTHDTAGGQLATYLAAIDAGVDAVDGAAALDGRDDQPAVAVEHRRRDWTTPSARRGLAWTRCCDLEPYWEAVRTLYAPFESGLRAPTGRVYRHEIPGGQLSNLRQQADALGLGDRFEEVELAYAKANALLGDIVKVTPTSKVVGDLALFVVSAGSTGTSWRRPGALRPPRLGDRVPARRPREPAGGLAAAVHRARAARPDGRAATEDGERARRPAAAASGSPSRAPSRPRGARPSCIFPGPDRRTAQRRVEARYGDVSAHPHPRRSSTGCPTDGDVAIELEPGVRLILELEAVGEPDERGMRTVLMRVNGQLRPIDVRDESIEAPRRAARARRSERDPEPRRGAADRRRHAAREQGDEVAEGRAVAVLEAMKMESTITAPRAGRVERVAAETGRRLEQGDLILVLTPDADQA